MRHFGTRSISNGTMDDSPCRGPLFFKLYLPRLLYKSVWSLLQHPSASELSRSNTWADPNYKEQVTVFQSITSFWIRVFAINRSLVVPRILPWWNTICVSRRSIFQFLLATQKKKNSTKQKNTRKNKRLWKRILVASSIGASIKQPAAARRCLGQIAGGPATGEPLVTESSDVVGIQHARNCQGIRTTWCCPNIQCDLNEKNS